MAENTANRACKKTDCQVALTGACADGHSPFESCPYFGERTAAATHVGYDGEIEDSSSGQRHEIKRVSLPPGEALTSEEVDQFLRWRAANFVCIIGDTNSGKTTFVCALYDRFLRGAFAGFAFVGSRTLVSLERRSHYARVESGRVTPETARTSLQEGLRYFHLAVAPVGQPERRSDLLLADRSGEIYASARANTSFVADLAEIPQANRVAILLDGRRVTDVVERNGAIQAVRQMLRALVDNRALGSTSTVQVITTKFDLIAASPDRQEIADRIATFRERLTLDFAPRLKSLSYYEIAARDPTNTFMAAYGMDDLLRDWIGSTPEPPSVPITALPLRSEFDRLLARTPMEKWP